MTDFNEILAYQIPGWGNTIPVCFLGGQHTSKVYPSVILGLSLLVAMATGYRQWQIFNYQFIPWGVVCIKYQLWKGYVALAYCY